MAINTLRAPKLTALAPVFGIANVYDLDIVFISAVIVVVVVVVVPPNPPAFLLPFTSITFTLTACSIAIPR